MKAHEDTFWNIGPDALLTPSPKNEKHPKLGTSKGDFRIYLDINLTESVQWLLYLEGYILDRFVDRSESAKIFTEYCHDLF